MPKNHGHEAPSRFFPNATVSHHPALSILPLRERTAETGNVEMWECRQYQYRQSPIERRTVKMSPIPYWYRQLDLATFSHWRHCGEAALAFPVPNRLSAIFTLGPCKHHRRIHGAVAFKFLFRQDLQDCFKQVGQEMQENCRGLPQPHTSLSPVLHAKSCRSCPRHSPSLRTLRPLRETFHPSRTPATCTWKQE